MRRVYLLAALVLAACSDSSSSDPSVSGDWRGSYSDGAVTYTADLAIAQQGQSITATGFTTLSVSPDTIPVTASGTYVHPDVTLIFSGAGTFAGTRNGSSIAGTITVGPAAYPLTFTRQ